MDNLSIEVTLQVIDSREVAEMLKTTHKELLRKLDGASDRKGYIQILTENQMAPSDYFIESTYKDNSGKENKCYLFTKMGCEFIANKFTGEKGILFTAKYVKKFNEMQKGIPRLHNELEMAKVEAQKARAEAMLLNAKNRTYKTLMNSIRDKHLSPIAVQVFGLKGMEGIFGVDVGNCLPETERTYSATEIGEMLGGISAQRIGSIAKENNLKTSEYGVWVMDKSRYSSKEVSCFRYNKKAIEKFKELIGCR